MKIGIFPACLGKNDAGPETYERELINGLASLPRGHEFHVYCFNPRARQVIEQLADRVKLHTLWPDVRSLSLSFSLPILLARDGISLYHATFVPAPFCPTQAVFTMHDVSPFTRKEYYPANVRRRLTALIERGMKTAKMVICISENCRETTCELFGISPEKTVVVPHGISSRFYPMDKEKAREAVKRRFNIAVPYILYVGKLEARKNICRLLRAFDLFRRENKMEVKLILAGKRFWDLEDMDRTIAELDMKMDVVELGYIHEQDLPALYSGAEVFVFPSLWEGFGFPVLEAMKCGTPVITSKISCLPEMAGDAALLVEPESVQQIAEALNRVVTNPQTKATMIRKGFAQAAKFSWQVTAQKTLATYLQAAKL